MENDALILGLAGLSEAEFLSAVSREPAKVKSAMSALVAGASKVDANSRAAFLNRMNILKPEVKQGLVGNDLQLIDHEIYVCKSISGLTNIDMFRDDDRKIAGMSNMSSGKLEKGEIMLVNEIIMLYGVGTGVTDATVAATDFGPIPAYIANGEWNWKANNKTYIDWMSTEIFRNYRKRLVLNTNATLEDISGTQAGTPVAAMSFGTGRIGSFKLDNPKLIETQVDMELTLKWFSAISAVTNSALKVCLHGSKLYKH